jgi:hypothetical protein
MIHRMLCEGRVCYPCAAMQAAAVVIHRMLWCRKGVLSLRCRMQAAVMITECSGGRRVCYPALPCKLAVVIHRMLWWKKGCYPALPCKKLAAVVIHRMLWWQGRVCYPCAVMQARCCHDPQNALVEEGCAIPALPCKLAAVVIHRMLWCREGVLCSCALSCKLAAVS